MLEYSLKTDGIGLTEDIPELGCFVHRGCDDAVILRTEQTAGDGALVQT